MIDLLPDPEQQELVEAARTFLLRELPTSRLREVAAAGTGYDRARWELCAKQGWYGLGLPEAAGGVGYTLVEEALLFRELGRHLVPGPVLPSVLGAHVAAGTTGASVPADGGLVTDILAGGAVVGLAEARPGEEDLLVWDTGPVDLLLVVDGTAHTATLARTGATAPGEAGPSIDPLVRLARLPPGALGATVAEADGAGVATHGTVLVAAMLSGLAEATRDLGAAYAQDRQQFGQAIGAFQAVKHRAADTAVRAESAWAQTAVAALRLASGAPGAPFHAAAAKVVAVDAAVGNGRDTIQNHGAIGFTAEHDAHLYLKRAHVLEHVLGDARAHLATVLDGAPD